MASSLERQRINISDLDQRLDNATLRFQCATPVCEKLNVRPICHLVSDSMQGRCLVEYSYPMTLGEVYDVAKESGFKERLEEHEAGYTTSEAFTGAEEVNAVEKQALPAFRPDWRFWTGITAAGLGLFLHRSR